MENVITFDITTTHDDGTETTETMNAVVINSAAELAAYFDAAIAKKTSAPEVA